MTLPTFILERRSLLEMYADFFGKFLAVDVAIMNIVCIKVF